MPPRGLPNWVWSSKDGIKILVRNDMGISKGGGSAIWRLGSHPTIELFKEYKNIKAVYMCMSFGNIGVGSKKCSGSIKVFNWAQLQV